MRFVGFGSERIYRLRSLEQHPFTLSKGTDSTIKFCLALFELVTPSSQLLAGFGMLMFEFCPSLCQIVFELSATPTYFLFELLFVLPP
jgi:hypothetical protein